MRTPEQDEVIRAANEILAAEEQAEADAAAAEQPPPPAAPVLDTAHSDPLDTSRDESRPDTLRFQRGE